MNPTPRAAAGLALTILAAVGLTACGSTDAGPVAASTSTPFPTTTSTTTSTTSASSATTASTIRASSDCATTTTTPEPFSGTAHTPPTSDSGAPLPALTPQLVENHSTVIGVGQSATADDGTRLAVTGRTKGPDHVVGRVLVEVTSGGRTRCATVPRGWSPVLFTTPLHLTSSGSGSNSGSASDAWMLSQEGGDSDRRVILVVEGDRLVAATVPSRVPFGSGFTVDGKAVAAYLTFATADGTGLFTTYGLPDGAEGSGSSDAKRELYSWALRTGATPTLVPTDLGAVCETGRTAALRRC